MFVFAFSVVYTQRACKMNSLAILWIFNFRRFFWTYRRRNHKWAEWGTRYCSMEMAIHYWRSYNSEIAYDYLKPVISDYHRSLLPLSQSSSYQTFREQHLGWLMMKKPLQLGGSRKILVRRTGLAASISLCFMVLSLLSSTFIKYSLLWRCGANIGGQGL